jgi:hypothetical protein
MDPLATNPLSILTFIVAPAILTNASSVMALGTSNRFARAIDRARALSAEIEGKDPEADPDAARNVRRLEFTERRARMLVRALTAFYVSVGSFGAASLVSLFAAGFYVVKQHLLRDVMLGIGLTAGVAGVGGLVIGSGLLVWETRLTLRVLQMETKSQIARRHEP